VSLATCLALKRNADIQYLLRSIKMHSDSVHVHVFVLCCILACVGCIMPVLHPQIQVFVLPVYSTWIQACARRCLKVKIHYSSFPVISWQLPPITSPQHKRQIRNKFARAKVRCVSCRFRNSFTTTCCQLVADLSAVSLKPCPHCRTKVRLSQKTARQRRQSHFSATVWTGLNKSTTSCQLPRLRESCGETSVG